jgi:hypothetical protein
VRAPGFHRGPVDDLCKGDVGAGDDEIYCRINVALNFDLNMVSLHAKGFDSWKIGGEQVIENLAFSLGKGSSERHEQIVRRG